MDRTIFFAHIRREPFSGALTTPQVAGVEAILSAWNFALDMRWLAYVLATVFHETAARMQPVREGLATSDASARRILAKYPYAQPDSVTGHAYYGRGHVQLTHKVNYERLGKPLGLDLVGSPDLALDPTTSIRILVLGMTNGLYTGKSLGDYFNAVRDDPVGARRIVNGTDRAGLIAGYHHAFLASLREATAEQPAPPAPEPVRETQAPRYPEEPKPLAESRTMAAQATAATGTAGASATELVGDSLNQAQGAAGQLAMYLDIAKWLFVGLIVAGIAWTVYARWDDHRKRVR